MKSLELENQRTVNQKNLVWYQSRLNAWLAYRNDEACIEDSRKETNKRIKLWISEIRKVKTLLNK